MEGQPHWINNFWGNDDAGYHQLMARVHNSKQTCDELKQFYKERQNIENEYSKRLSALSRKALGSQETGNMKQAMDMIRTTTQSTAANHETVARQITEQLVAPLEAYTSTMRGRTKMVEDVMRQLTRAKTSQNHSSEKARNRYMAECNKISGYQAQQNLLMGRELDKNNQKLDKAACQVETLQRQYQDGLRALAQTIENWNAEWRNSCCIIKQIEEERLTFTKANMWAYANSLNVACVADDEACEAIRTSLEKCDPVQDLENYCREYGTGCKIQDPPEFVNFLQGFSRELDTEDGHYHMANFSSTLEDHAVPNLRNSSASLASNSLSAQITPMSSPGTTSLEKYLDVKAQSVENPQQLSKPKPVQDTDKVKKRRSWAMPFKWKSHPDMSRLKYVSTLDQPIANTPQQQTPQQHPTQQHPAQSFDSRRQSWAPSSLKPESMSDALHNSPQEDPLLTAMERLRTPNMKARPKPYNYTQSLKGASPYENGSPTHSNSHSNENFSRRPVQRRQVGSDNGPKLPMVTSDGQPVIRHSYAQFDYRAAIPEELTFCKGDLLLVTEMQEDGWWFCEVVGPGSVGLAPSNYLIDAC